MQLEIKPELLRWACERAGFSLEGMEQKFPHLPGWVQGTSRPTLKQLEKFAKAVYAPVGYFFLQKPPVESIPIPDFRTIATQHAIRPSPDLLETVYVCQQRQEWYRDFARSIGEKPLSFVGSATEKDDVVTTAARIRQELGFDLEQRSKMLTWTEALRSFIEKADTLGVMVMCSGVVMNNNRRHLNPDEFRGFAISDNLAPLVFINGKDTKSAQMFTLAHELAHIWLGSSAVSDAQASWMPDHGIERWCNCVAAEVLVPLAVIKAEYEKTNDLPAEVNRLARRFKVSTLVILRRIHDAGGITQDRLWEEYKKELKRLSDFKKGTGGDFYLTQAARVSKRFARALVISTLEGQTLYRDAFRMLGFSKLATFRELGHTLGVA
jgi:Zn-dependent peptidase ImmA (M78 family)/transcriptional regulator with XRE-family HTH domain